MKDLYNKLAAISGACAAPTDNTAVVSPIVDVQKYAALAFFIISGTLADADATFTVLLEESNDSGMSGATAVADADLLGTEAAASLTFANDGVVRKLGYRGYKRYVRLTITPAGNASAAPLAVIAIGDPTEQPAAT